MSNFEKTNLKIIRNRATFFFEIDDNNNKILMPFIQFSTKNVFWKPKVVSNDNGIIYGGWLFIYFGIISKNCLDDLKYTIK